MDGSTDGERVEWGDGGGDKGKKVKRVGRSGRHVWSWKGRNEQRYHVRESKTQRMNEGEGREGNMSGKRLSES
jgi:hypothetical protein